MFVALKKLLEDERNTLWGKLFSGAGLTAGGVATYEFFEFVKANPAASLGLVKEFGPIFALAVLLTALINRMIGVMEKGTESSQQMADAMRQIADKDDRQAERMELLTQYNAQRAQESADSMSALHSEIRLQNSALDRIEKRQQGMEIKLDQLHPAHEAHVPLEGKGLPT